MNAGHATFDDDAALELARKHVRRRELDRAVAVLDDLLKSRPDHVDACETMATAQFLRKDFGAAAEWFEKLARLQPAKADAYVNLGAVYNRMQAYDKAVDAVRRGLQRDRRCSEAYYNLGIAERGLGRNAMAVSAYREALKIAPEMVEAHNNLANALVEMGNHQQAIMHFEKALEIEPSFERAQRGLERAREAVDESRRNANPFGRLVDAPAQSASEPGPARGGVSGDVRVEELVEKQAELRSRSIEVKLAVEQLGDALRDDLLPALLALNREVARVSDDRRQLHTVRETFHQGLERVVATRKSLASTMNVVRDVTTH